MQSGVNLDICAAFLDWDESFRYYAPETNADNGTSWAVIQPSSDSCNTPQWITSRLGDYMAFMFTVSQPQRDLSGISPHVAHRSLAVVDPRERSLSESRDSAD